MVDFYECAIMVGVLSVIVLQKGVLVKFIPQDEGARYYVPLNSG
jgi:hypothetical protein